MNKSNSQEKVDRIHAVMIESWAKTSILSRACACTVNEGKCPFGGNLLCLQSNSLDIHSFPPDCREPAIELCLESAKTVWKAAEIYAEDISLSNIITPALQQFLDDEKAKRVQIKK